MSTHGVVRNLLLVMACLAFAVWGISPSGQAWLQGAGHEYVLPMLMRISEVAAQVFDSEVIQPLLNR